MIDSNSLNETHGIVTRSLLKGTNGNWGAELQVINMTNDVMSCHIDIWTDSNNVPQMYVGCLNNKNFEGNLFNEFNNPYGMIGITTEMRRLRKNSKYGYQHVSVMPDELSTSGSGFTISIPHSVMLNENIAARLINDFIQALRNKGHVQAANQIQRELTSQKAELV